MRAMILAAGLGTRLKPFTDHHPKALAVVNDKSLLQRNIEYLQHAGIQEVIVNVHHFSDQIIQAITNANGWGTNVTISDETNEVLETGGGVLKAAPYFANEKNWLVMNADILTNMNLASLMQVDQIHSSSSHHHIATLAVTNRTSSRNLLFNDAGHLVGWKNNTTGEEKWVNQSASTQPYTAKAFSGIQIIHQAFYQALSFTGKFSLIDAYLQIAATHTIGCYDHSDSILLDVGKPESLEKAATLFA